jgi:hypothetical protein
MEASSDDGGHAFVILGYTPAGFIIQSSGAPGGAPAVAPSYQDWTDNAMDCWVTQLGVATTSTSRSPARRRCA